MSEKDSVEVPAYFPPISGAFKSTSEGGARITLELDPLAAAQLYPFYIRTTVQGQEESFFISFRRGMEG